MKAKEGRAGSGWGAGSEAGTMLMCCLPRQSACSGHSRPGRKDGGWEGMLKEVFTHHGSEERSRMRD